MPQNKRKVIGPDGSEVEATVLPYQVGGEHWNEYLIDDGTVIRLKPVVTDVMRLDGHYDLQGNPMYLVQSTNVVSVNAPDSLRKG